MMPAKIDTIIFHINFHKSKASKLTNKQATDSQATTQSTQSVSKRFKRHRIISNVLKRFKRFKRF